MHRNATADSSFAFIFHIYITEQSSFYNSTFYELNQSSNGNLNQNLCFPLPAAPVAADILVVACGLVLDLSLALGADEAGWSVTLVIWKVVWRYHFPPPSFAAFLN